MERRLVLASASPRRRLLLETAGYTFTVDPPDIDEVVRVGEPPVEMVMRLAGEKALYVAARHSADHSVLACDTTVVLDDEILGKPSDPGDAIEALLRLGGRSHQVISGYSVVSAGASATTGTSHSRVFMRPIGRDEAAAYVATGEPLDKAGSYGIQGRGRQFVERWIGSFTNIMGLPMEAVEPVLASLGIVATPAPPRAR